MPAPEDEPPAVPSDATRWDDVAPEVPTQAGETTRLDGVPPAGSAGATAADPGPPLDVTRWEDGEVRPPLPAPSQPGSTTRWDAALGDRTAVALPPARPDLGLTRWETTRGDRTAIAPAPAHPDAGATRWEATPGDRTADAPTTTRPDPGATRWEDEAAPGRGPTMRFDAVLPPPGAPAPRPSSTTVRWAGVLPLPDAPRDDVTRMTLDGDAPLSTAPPAPAPPPAADASPFELLGELGRGGMGVVHLARERATGREVALKVVLVDVGTARERLVREGQVTASLQHPNILRVHGAGVLDGRPYLAYELVEGCRSYDEAIRTLPMRARVELLRDAARGLGYAHARGIFHRDVKPANLLVDVSGRVRVADFGLAAGVGLERLTRTGAQVGTPAYMAPEQVDARREDVGPWTDVWALGVVLYQALTERRPFEGQSFTQLCAAILEREPAPPRSLAPEVTPALEAVCLKALSKRPVDRYVDGEAMARDLERALAGERVEARPRRPHRLRRIVLAAAVAGALVGAAVAARAHAERQAVVAKTNEARAALAAARHAYGTRIDDLLAAAAAHRAAELALAGLPPETAAELLAEQPGLAERRADVLARLVPALLAEGRPDEAVVHARDLARVAPSPASRRWLLQALVATPPCRPEALALARELLQAPGDDRRAAAEALLQLHRPAEVLAALQSVDAPDLRLLAARAALGARRPEAALALSRDAAGDAVERAVLLARALVALGRADEALAAIEQVRAEGGGRWEWLAARAAVDAARGLPGAARATYAVALAAAERASPAAAEAVRVERGRHHLRRGRAEQALVDLERARDPAARLDAALARWCLGGPDDALATALEEARAAVAAFEAPPHLEGAVARWRAWLLLCGGAPRDDVLAALAALAPDDPLRAWGDARATWRDQGAAAALERLERLGAPASDPDLRAARARLLAAVPARRDAAREALADLPPGSPAHADVARALLVDASEAEVARADAGAARARVVPRPSALALPVASEDAPGAEALASSLYRQARLVMPAARDAAARDRCIRLLARVVALDPDHAFAQAERARFAHDVEAADRAVARWPSLTDVRHARLILHAEIDPESDEALADAEALLAAGADDVRLQLVKLTASMRAARGDLDGAWALLEPHLGTAEREVIDLAWSVARDRGDEAGRTRASRRRARLAAAEGSRRTLENDLWVQSELGAVEREWTDLPRDGEYWGFRATLALHVSEQLEGLLSFGRYVLEDRPTPPTPKKFLLVAHSFGFNPLQLNQKVVADLRRAAAEAPDDPAPYLAHAGYLSSAFHRSPADDPALPPRAELPDAAADMALMGAALAPERGGPLMLAAWCLIDAGDLAEARALLDRVATPYGDIELVCFLRARAAAAAGDAGEARRWLEAMKNDPRTTDSVWRFEDDPAFQRVLGRPGFAIPRW